MKIKIPLIVASLLLISSIALATPASFTSTYSYDDGSNIAICTITGIANSSDGTFPSTVLLAAGCPAINGTLISAQVTTGSTKPSAGFSVTILQNGADLLGGNLSSLTTAGAIGSPLDRSGSACIRPIFMSSDSIAITSTSVPSSNITIYLNLLRSKR